MILRHPWLLLLLLLIPLLIKLRHGSQKRAAIRYSDGDSLKRIPPSFAVIVQPLLPLLFGLGLAFLVVALARPQRGLEESTMKTEAVDIVLLVDVSTSMRAIDFSTSTKEIDRLAAAKQVIRDFIGKRPHDRLGMVAFSGLPYSVSPLTLDHGWLLQRMDMIQTGMLEDGTAIGTAIASAVNRLRESKAKSKVVVLLTDGINNAGDLTPENSAMAAKALGIKIYTVGAGASGIVTMPVQDAFGGKRYIRQQSDIDDATLTKIAEATGGRYFRATDLESLQKVYEEIDKLEKTEIEVQQFTRFEERFAPLVLAGIFCLGLERLLALSRMGRIP